MPRRKNPQFPGEHKTPSPGEIVNYFEDLPVEFAAIVVDILQARVTQRRADTMRRLQQPPDPPPATTPGTPAAPPAPRQRRQRRGVVPLVPPQETVGDDTEADVE